MINPLVESRKRPAVRLRIAPLCVWQEFNVNAWHGACAGGAGGRGPAPEQQAAVCLMHGVKGIGADKAQIGGETFAQPEWLSES